MMIVKVVSFLTLCFAVAGATLVGAPTDSDMHNPEAKKALNFAVSEYNAKSPNLYLSRVLDVISVQTQVVAGVKYSFTVKMAETSCPKKRSKTACGIVANAVPRECQLTVWSKPWENFMQLLESTC